MPSPPAYNSDTCDVVVVGASFAGLSFASIAAVLGLRVLVVERDTEVGGVVRTTGVLFNDVLDVVDVPARYLINAIRRIQLQPPNHPPIEVSTHTYRFYMADVPGMIHWMAEQAEERGATIRCGTTFLDQGFAGGPHSASSMQHKKTTRLLCFVSFLYTILS